MRQVLAAAVLAATLALAGCASGSTHTDSTVACKAAMARDYAYALTHPDAPAATRPPACKGLPDATIQKLAAEIMAGNTAGPG